MLFKRKRKIRAIITAQPGDIIGFSGANWMSAGINLATYGVPFWGLSHVGIVGKYNDQLVLFESTTLSDLPCLVQEKYVNGVQVHEIDRCVRKYNGRVWHYPLVHSLSPVKRIQLNSFLFDFIGTDYDAIGAFRAGGVIWSWLESKLRWEDLSSIFCSELCAAAHKHVDLFDANSASRWSPNKLVRTERRQGILGKPRRIK